MNEVDLSLVHSVNYAEVGDTVVLGVGPEQWLEYFDIKTWPQIDEREPVDLVVSLGRGIHGGKMTPAQKANVRLACDVFGVSSSLQPTTRKGQKFLLQGAGAKTEIILENIQKQVK
jgi:hypothetical protein